MSLQYMEPVKHVSTIGEELALLIDAVKDYAIFMLDPAGNITSWNAGAERIKGYRPEEIIGRHFTVFYPPEDVAAGAPQRLLAKARQDGRVESEGWRLRKDGTRFWADVVLSAIYDAQGTLRGFAKVTRDVTDRLRASEAERALAEEREAKLRAEASYQAAEEASRAKDAFLMTLSHELRTPMTAILGWTRLLPQLDPREPEFRDALEAISRGATLQAQLIEDVLDVSKILSGKMRLRTEWIEVDSVIQNAVDSIRASTQAKQLDLQIALDPDLGNAQLDPTRLQQIIWNLLSNAVKFTPARGRIVLEAKRVDGSLDLVVSDTGEGIPADFLPRIFEPFSQADNRTVRAHSGLGLGLSIVRHLVEAHGGTIQAASEGPGTGTRFRVRLPIAHTEAPAQSKGAKQEERLEPGGRLSAFDVLVVEDDESTREMLRATLRRAGALVRTADSAAAAIKRIEERNPDVVLTDIAMPIADGYDLLRSIRESKNGSGMAVVALTAFGAVDPSRGSNFDAFLRKPIEPGDLVDTILRVRNGA